MRKYLVVNCRPGMRLHQLTEGLQEAERMLGRDAVLRHVEVSTYRDTNSTVQTVLRCEVSVR